MTVTKSRDASKNATNTMVMIFINCLTFTWTWCCNRCGKIISQIHVITWQIKSHIRFTVETWHFEMTYLFIGFTLPSNSRPFLTLVSHLFVAFTEPAAIFTFPTIKIFTFLFSSFSSVYNSLSSFCFFSFTLPIDLPQSQTSWLWMLPSKP